MNRTNLSVVPAAVVAALGLSISPGHGELIGFYPFDDAAAPLNDQSGKGNTLTSTGLDPVREAAGGLSGAAYRFDGGQHFQAPINLNFDFNPLITMGAWVRTTTLEAALRKVMGHDNGGWDRTIGLDTRNLDGSAGPFRYSSFTGSGPGPEELPGPKSTEDWTFIAATYDDSTAQTTVYVDIDANTVGDDVVSVAVSDSVFNVGFDNAAIGNLRPDAPDEGWIGYIDNAFFFDEVLTAAQITSMRNRGTPQLNAQVDPNFSAVSVPDLSAVPKAAATHDFSIPIRNDGAAQVLHITSATVTGPDAGYYSVRTFPGQLTAGQAGTIDLTLTPQGQVGPFKGVLVVMSDDSVQPRSTLDVSATVVPDGTTDPALTVVTPDPIFGERGMSPSTATIEIRNSGAAKPLTLSAAVVVGADAANYTVNSFPPTIAPGATGTLSVTFDPKGVPKTFAAQLQLTSTDAAGRTRLVNLTATVKASDIRPSLIGFYPFDDAGNPKKDESGNGKDLTDPAGASAFPPTYDPQGGREGGGFVFDGTQLLVVPININPGAIPELTMGAWVKTASLEPAPLRKVIGHDNGAWDRTIGLDNREGEFRYSAFTGINSTGPLVGLPAPESDQTWTFLAATYNQTRNELIVYIDLDTSTTTDALVTASDQNATFGAGFPTAAIGDLRPDGPSEAWVGSIDNVFFYNTVLSEAQVTQVRNGGKAFILSGGSAPAPRITAVSANATAVSLTWSSANGATYAVQYTEKIPATWAPIATQASQGASTSYQDSDATRRGKPTGFYRIAVQP